MCVDSIAHKIVLVSSDGMDKCPISWPDTGDNPKSFWSYAYDLHIAQLYPFLLHPPSIVIFPNPTLCLHYVPIWGFIYHKFFLFKISYQIAEKWRWKAITLSFNFCALLSPNVAPGIMQIFEESFTYWSTERWKKLIFMHRKYPNLGKPVYCPP